MTSYNEPLGGALAPPLCQRRVSAWRSHSTPSTTYRIQGRKNLRNVGSKVNHLLSYFGHDRAKDVTTDRVKAYIARRQEEQATDAQINRELAALKRMFNLAAEAEKITHVPYIPMLRENNVRTGFFEDEEFVALRHALPPFVRPVATFRYYPGCRKRGSEIDFVSAYQKVGLKEAGKLLKEEFLEASSTLQVKEALAVKRVRRHKRKASSKQDPSHHSLVAALA